MFREAWTRTLAASVTPMVVISAIGLLSLAFYNRYAAIVSRLRGLQRERLSTLQTIREEADTDPADADLRRTLLRGLEAQTANVMGRARLIRFTLQCLLVAVALLILSSLLHGATTFWEPLAIPAAVVFVAGMASFLCAISAAFVELCRSLDGVATEDTSVTVLTIVSDESA